MSGEPREEPPPADEVKDQGGEEHEKRQWSARAGRLRFYNAPARLAQSPPIADVPMDARTVDNAFVSRCSVIGKSTVQRSRQVYGAIYDRQKLILPDLSNVRDVREDLTTVDSRRVASAEPIAGRCVYLGVLERHFGHFLLETLSRAWFLINLDPDVKIILHSNGDEEANEFQRYLVPILRILSIDPGRVVLANRHLLIEQLIIPSPQFWPREKATRGFCRIFDHIREQLERAGRSADGLPKKLYLTRREFSPVVERRLARSGKPAGKVQGLNRRLTLNEAEVEQVFGSYGFHVVAPEKLSFEDQIMLIGNATHVAGIAGSALHMVLFNNSPAAKLIELSTRHVANQLIVNNARDIEGVHIFCVRQLDQDGRPELDLAILDKALREVL